MYRFYCPTPAQGFLDEHESHHCAQVLRQQAGDFITVFDGRGLEVKAKITTADSKRVAFAKTAEHRTEKRRDQLCLAQAITKPKAFEAILQKATELGVTDLVPLQSERTVSQVDEEKAEARVAKWNQVVIEAAKQCGQNWLPTVHPIQKPKTFLAESARAYRLKLIASLQDERKPLRVTMREQVPEGTAPQSIVVMIGPEGDYTPAEIGDARAAGFLPVSLGPIILRSDTAAIYALSALNYELAG
jgi:16S rRNA (uracil1498-N3)-methyltransferase